MASVVRPPVCGVATTSGRAASSGRGHLVGRAADVERGAGDASLVEGDRERRLVDEVAAREIDQECIAAHEPQLRRADQIFGLLRRHRQRQYEIGALQQLVELDLLDLAVLDHDVRVVDQNLHAERQGEIGDAAAKRAVADDAGGGAGELAAPGDRRGHAGLVGDVGARDAARGVDHEADRQLAHRRHPAAARLRDEDAVGRRARHVDVADVDGDAQDGHEVGQRGEHAPPRTPSPGRRR